jgi:hypothetical protein
MCAGLVGELIVYDELLTDAHAAEVLEYLSARWWPTPARRPMVATLGTLCVYRPQPRLQPSVPQVGARLRAMGVTHVRRWWHRQRPGQERRARWR